MPSEVKGQKKVFVFFFFTHFTGYRLAGHTEKQMSRAIKCFLYTGKASSLRILLEKFVICGDACEEDAGKVLTGRKAMRRHFGVLF